MRKIIMCQIIVICEKHSEKCSGVKKIIFISVSMKLLKLEILKYIPITAKGFELLQWLAGVWLSESLYESLMHQYWRIVHDYVFSLWVWDLLLLVCMYVCSSSVVHWITVHESMNHFGHDYDLILIEYINIGVFFFYFILVKTMIWSVHLQPIRTPFCHDQNLSISCSEDLRLSQWIISEIQSIQYIFFVLMPSYYYYFFPPTVNCICSYMHIKLKLCPFQFSDQNSLYSYLVDQRVSESSCQDWYWLSCVQQISWVSEWVSSMSFVQASSVRAGDFDRFRPCSSNVWWAGWRVKNLSINTHSHACIY